MDSRPCVDWIPLPHEPGCDQPQWLVHERGRGVLDGPRLELRFVCPSCGAVHLLTVDTGAGPEARWGVTDRVATFAHRIGYGCPPRRAAGLWLWPYPVPNGMDEPTNYVVTAVKARPACREQIAGAVVRYRTERGARRWLAAVGYDPAEENRDGFGSIGAAARWLADRLAPDPVPPAPDPPERPGAER